MREVTAWFVVLAPVMVLCCDLLVWCVWGQEATISGVVWGWAERSSAFEFCYLIGVTVLYLHLFRNWPS